MLYLSNYYLQQLFHHALVCCIYIKLKLLYVYIVYKMTPSFLVYARTQIISHSMDTKLKRGTQKHQTQTPSSEPPLISIQTWSAPKRIASPHPIGSLVNIAFYIRGPMQRHRLLRVVRPFFYVNFTNRKSFFC